MKWVLYSIALVFMVGGAVCSPETSVAQPNSTDQTTTPTRLDDKAEAASYTKDVRPFLATYCNECHTGTKAKAGFNFEDYDALMKGSRKGKAVVAGEPDKSTLIRVLTGKGKRMPPAKYKNQPKAEDVDALKAWITAGAKDDTEKGDAEKKQANKGVAPAGRAAVVHEDADADSYHHE
jgi:mono/diheme cytochrome c family protein